MPRRESLYANAQWLDDGDGDDDKYDADNDGDNEVKDREVWHSVGT